MSKRHGGGIFLLDAILLVLTFGLWFFVILIRDSRH